MMSAIEAGAMPPDNWQPAAHTDLENAMRRVITVLVSRAFPSSVEYAEFVRANPVIWGNE